MLATFPAVIDLGPLLKSFADTAAAIAQLDLVIAVDTSVAHLAGRSQIRLAALPFAPDWRWLLDRGQSVVSTMRFSVSPPRRLPSVTAASRTS